MEKEFKPKDFIGCNLVDETYLDKDGFLIASNDSKTNSIRLFNDIILEYSLKKKLRNLSFSIYKKSGCPIGFIDYYQDHPPFFQIGGGLNFVERQYFVDYFLEIDSNLALWMLWNI